MPINDKVLQLYNAMKADGADVGTEQEFNDYFLAKGDQGYKNRKAVWDAFKADGADVGENYEEFAGWLGLKPAKPVKQTKPYNQATDNFGAGVSNLRQAINNQQKAEDEQLLADLSKPSQSQQGGYTPTWQEQWGADITSNNAENAALNATRPIDQRQRNAEVYMQNFGRAPEIGRQGRVVSDNGGYITEDASRNNLLVDANMDQRILEMQYMDSMDKELREALARQSQLKKEMDSIPTDWVDQDGNVHTASKEEKERYAELAAAYKENEQELKRLATNERMMNIREAQGRNTLNDVDRQLDELGIRREKAEEEVSFINKFSDFVSNLTHPLSAFGLLPSQKEILEGLGARGKELQNISQEENILNHRRELARESIDLINELRTEQNGGLANLGLATAARNVWNTAAKRNTWDFGVHELDREFTIAQAIIKMDSGQKLSDNEKALLNDWAYNNAVSEQFGEQLSGWAKAGMVTGESLPFMLEMALNPLSGLGEGTTKALTKYAVKRYGSKWVRNHIKSVVAGKIATRAVADIAGAYGMATTTGAARTAADAIRRTTGQADIDIDPNGDIIFNGIKQDTKDEPLMAFFKAFNNTAIENWSEMAGNYLGFLSDFFGKVIGKSVIGKAGREMLSATGSIEGVSLNKAQKFIYELAAGKGIGAFSEGLAQFAKQTQWHGMGNEYLEEVMGNIANAAIVGDMTFDTAENTGVFNLQQNIDTFCGVALMGGFMSALHTGGFVAHKLNYNLDKVNEDNSKLFGDELWGDIKTMIDNSYNDPRELNNALTYILRGDSGKQYSPEEKKAVLKYTQAVLENEGAEMVDYKPRMASSNIAEVTGEGGNKQWQVTSSDINGDAISQQTFDTEEEAKAYEGELKMQQQHQDYKDSLKMSTKLSYKESEDFLDYVLANYKFYEKDGRELDPSNEEDFANIVSQIQDMNTGIGRDFQRMKEEAQIEKAHASQKAIADFENANGWAPGTVAWLAEQDPIELDAEGLQMQDQASAFLEGLAYPAGEVHVEHEQQVGTDAGQQVVENVVSTEEPIDPQNNIGKDIQDQWNAAQAARQASFEKDENLKEEVERGEAMGLSPQEIVSSLDWARPEQQQAMIDYYNAQARYESMINAAAKKIDEEAANSRQRHTFKGTINGNPDLSNVYTISDGTNEYYLVSGNVTTDPATGRITGSDSGLIIGMDADGNFVNISDTNGYSVVPPSMSLDQFEEAERIKLQEQVTSVVDPTGSMMQQPQEESGAVDTGTGANEPLTPATSEEQQQQEPSVTIESVTGEDGVKRYELGIPVDDAIADMQADGLDVNDEADLAINEAQAELNKIKQPKTRAERVKNAQRQQELQNTIDYYNNVKARWAEVNAEAEPAEQPQKPTLIKSWQTKKGRKVELFIMPETVDEDGNRHVKIGRSIDGGEISTGHANGIDVSTGLIDYEATYAGNDEVEERDKEDGTRYIVTEVIYLPDGRISARGTIAGDKASFWLKGDPLAPANSEENVNVQPEQPTIAEKPVSSQQNLTVEEQKQQRIAYLKERLGEYFDDDFTKANDVFELVSMWIGRNRNLAWEDVNGKRGLQKELGWTRKIGGDTKYIETLLAKNGEGIGVDEFVHMVWESPENSIGEDKRWSTEEIKDAMLELLRGADSKSWVVDYALVNREAQAVAAMSKAQQEAREAAERQEGEPAEVELIPDNGLPFAPATDEDFTNDVNENNNEADNNVSLQPENKENDEQESMGGPNQEGDGGSGENETASDVLRRVSIAAAQTGSGSRSKERLLAQLEESARDSGYWIEDDISQIEDLKVNTGGENEVYKTRDGSSAIKLNNFNFLRDDATDFEDFFNRLESNNELFPDVALEVIGFAKNSKGEVCVVLQQPWIEADREATEEEIDAALEEMDFYTDISGNWTDGQYEIADLKPNNVLVDKEGNLHFIDVVTFDSTKPGQMMKAKKPAPPEQEQPQTQSREDYLASHPLTEEQIMADTEANEDEKLNAIDFLKGEDDSAISRFYYDSIYERAQKTSSSENRKKKEEKPQQPQPRWQYQFHYDKETGRAWITRDDWSGGVPIGDGRFRIEGRSLAELRGILENPKNNLGELLKEIDAQLHNAEELEKWRRENDPMAAIEDAASLFRGEQEQKSQDQKDIDDALKEFNDFLDNAKGSNVLDKFMHKGLKGNDKAQANLLDAFTFTNEAQRMFLKDLLRLASKVGYAYIKSGIHDVQAWSKKMSDTIGRKLNEVLGWDDAIIGEFVDEVWNQKYTVDGQRMRLSEHAERLKNGKGTDTTVNVNKKENNETENVVNLQQKPASELEGDSAEFADRQEKEKAFRDEVKLQLLHGVTGDRTLRTMQDVKKLAEKHGLDMSMTDLQELVEAAIVSMARGYANNSFLTDKQKFDNIVALYETQPTLSARDNDRINKQQYSTPAPMGFLMGLFTSKDKKVNSGLEPSAGNGMLTVNLPKEKMHVNDIDEMRLSNLQKQGFGEVTSQDGLQSFGEKKYDVVVTNPPFGNVTPKVYDGIYEISGLEHQMAINALESMKDDGRAAIIIGGNTEYNQNGSIKGKDRTFLNYLYAHYNVVDVINMNGHELYSRQGTGFPVRMILINGRKEFNPRSFAPVIQKARAERVNSYDELFKRVNDDILSDSNKPASVHDTESGESRRVDDTSNAGASTQTGVRNVQPTGSQSQPAGRDANGSSVSGSNNTTGRTDTAKEPVVDTRPTGVGSRTETSQPSRPTAERTEEQRNESRGNNTERPAASTDNSQRVGQRGAESAQQPEQPAVKRGLGTEKVPYRKQSGNPLTLQSLMPAEQADVVKSALEELGDVDQFLVDELGYSSKEELHQALAAEQIDSVALAIHQMNQGSAFIIGDQTGIGKGRQAAALIRYGVKKGGFPVFITVKKALFSDMYRDLCDIGSPRLRPFIWSADDTEHSGNVTDKNGNVIYQTPSAKEQKRVVDYINKYGKLPPEYDYVLTTYDSFKSGTVDYEDGKKKARNFGKKKVGPVHINGQAKRDALETLAGNSYVIMDESHNAGGEGSNVSNYLQYITTKAKGLTFLSATFAKRPGNMPIYSLKTAISKAGVSVGELIDAVKRGGATFQEIMSKALTEAGQMIRRERNMEGVTIDWRGIEDESVIQKQREQYDTIIGLFNDIISFQRAYVDPIVNGMNDAAAEEQGEVNHTPGTRDMGINNTPFASRTYNMVQQVLLSLKAEEAAKRAIEHLKLGRKPVITVANTNEGAADEAAGMGEAMEMPDLSVNLKKGLQGTLRITKKDAFGNTVNEMIPFDRLSEEGRKRYQEIVDAIENASSGLSLSPIDVIKNELKKAGYKVGELTGRKAEFVYNEDGTVNRVKRQDTDKKRIAADFNNGKLDALILNRSAGTGISLHASSTFKDQRQRIMIVAQAQGDVNDEVQIRGRIDRTGQVLRGMYEYVVSQIPSEQRLLMMLKAKLRSLDANTTSSQKSKFNEMQVQDIINKYGDDIVIQYLAEHPDLAMKMCDPLKWGEGAETLPAETLVSQAQKAQGDGATASKVLGRMALLTVKEQEKMLQEVGELYQAEIDRLNEMGENDLEITEMPLRAKTMKKDVWEDGVEPGGKNPFADNSYVEEVEMDVLKKPMKAEEVKKSQERLLGGKTWDEYKQSVLDRVDAWAENKKAETTKTITERAEKKATAEKEKYAKGAKKAQEKNGMTDEEIERNAGYQYNTFYKQEMEKLQNAIDGVDKQKQAFVDALETFSTEGVYALPTDIYDLSQITFEPSFGKVIDIKISDNFSTTASTISFATLDGRRKITIPISGMVKQQNGEKRDIKPIIIQQTAQTRHGMFGSNVANTLKVLEQNVDNWDKLTSTATRKKGHIITGNLLKALTSLRSQGKGGKLISYTTDTGEVRQGILMSDQFDPGALTSKSPISSAKKDLDDWEKDYKIASADGDVTVKRGRFDWRNNTYDYTLQVPKSKKRGDKYFNDKTLLGLMDGQFEGSSKMSADFPASNLDAVLKRLDELGVTVEGSKEDSPKRMITTHDQMEAISQAADSWRRENMPKVIKNFINGLADKFGLKGAVPTYVINSQDDLEAMREKVSADAFKDIEELYNEPDTGAGYIPRADIVVVFGEKIESPKETESIWWHEQAHGYWQRLPKNLRESFGEACLDYLFRHHRADYNHIINDYPEEDHLNEACSFFIGQLIREYGSEKILGSRFEGIEEICNFANGLINYIKNEREQRQRSERNPLRSGGANSSVNGNAEVDGRDSQRRERGDQGLRNEEESELQEEVDPLEAIELSAKRWKKIQEDIAEAGKSVKQLYTDTLDKEGYVWTEAWQDSMLALKVFQNSALKKGEEIADSQNAYMFENLMHGKNRNEMDLYNVEYRDPLLDTVNKIVRKLGWTMRDMNRYLLTKSGLERNRELYVRDWLEAERKHTINEYSELNEREQEIYAEMANRIETDFEDGNITEEQKDKKLEQAVNAAHIQYLSDLENEWLNIKSRWNRRGESPYSFKDYISDLTNFIKANIDEKYKPEKNDYSGLTEMYGDEEGKYNEADIITNLMADEGAIGSNTSDVLWSQIKAANRYALERYRESGMRSDEEIDRIEKMFNFYVPMRGFDMETGEDMYQYFTSRSNANSYVGGLIKHAKGRESMANSPLSTMFGMSYKAIKDCNQNLMLQRFYRFCQAHPNDLTVLSDAWVKWDEGKQEWVETWPEIADDATEDEVRKATLDYEAEMKRLSSEGKAKKISGKAKIDYIPIDKKHKAEHTVEVRINGQKKLITVVGNPRLAQALNGHTRWENGRNIVSKINANIKNKMSSAFTSYSPTFAARNMLRDWTHFRMMLSVREGEGYAKAASHYYKETFPRPWHGKGKIGMVKLFKKYRSGTLDMNNEVERDFKDFMDNGGVTGYVQMQKIDQMEKEIKKLVGDRSDSQKMADRAKYWLIDNLHLQGAINLTDKAWDAIIGLVEAYNEAVENNARFATYRASRHYANRTKARSAYDAKEITVNFNRKGSGAKARNLKNSQGEVSLAAETAGLTSQVIGEGRIFNNATVQAIATTFKNFRNPDGSLNWPYIRKWAARYATPPFMLGLALPFINKALAAMIDSGDGDDDNPYANLPEWTRRKNLCIYIGNNNFITIPIGQELAAFLTLGDITAGMTYEPDLKPVDKDWLDETRSVLTTFSPIDLDTKITEKEGAAGATANIIGRLSSVMAPIVAVGENVGWTGRPIYKEDKYDNDKLEPEYKQVYQSTNPLLVKASKKLHELGGGTDRARGREITEVNPAVVQYLWEQYTGGPGKLFSNTISLGKDAGDLAGQLWNGESIDTDFNMRKVEGLKAFISQGDDQTEYYRARTKFYKYESDAKKFQHDHDISNLENLAKHKDPVAQIELDSLEKGVDYTRFKIIRDANHSDKRRHKVGLDEMRKDIANTTDRKEKQKKQQDYNILMKQTVDKLDQVGKE